MIQAFGLPVSNANDAEGQIRQIIWSFGGAMFAKDGKTVTFNSPETRAAYQFIADMVAEGTIPRSAADLGRCRQQQRLPDRPRRLHHQPAQRLRVDAGERQGAPRQHRADQHPEGPGREGPAASPSARGCGWCRRPKQSDAAKGWLRYFFEPTRYQKIIETVGGRWLPIYPAMMSMPLFKDKPDYAKFGEMARSGIIDGYGGPPTALASGQRRQDRDAVIQKILVDGMSTADAVAWGQAEMEKLAM